MAFRKTILYVAFAILGIALWHAWQHDHRVRNTDASANVNATASSEHPADFAPTAYDHQKAAHYTETAKNISRVLPTGKMVTVKTDLFDANINLRGGNLVSVKLVKFPVSLEKKDTPVQILNPKNSELYIAQSGVTSSNEKDHNITYASSKASYQLNKGEKELQVTLTGKTSQGLLVHKVYTFNANSYVIHTDLKVDNQSGKPWKGSLYNQIMRRYVSVNGKFYSRAYTGAAFSTPNSPYKKLTFSDMYDSNLSRNLTNSWIAMQQHYFLSAWIPPKAMNLHFYSRSFGNGEDGKNNLYVLGYVSPKLTLNAGEKYSFASRLYVGPESAKNLKPLAKGLDLTVDYGLLWPISKFLFWLMSEIHHFVGNWGWSIILVTILIKLAFYGLSSKSYRSMAKTRELQPRIQALKERHGDDRQAMSKAMMELYRKEKINPVGGCLPMVIQIPVFIALYYVLIESVELRQAPFIFWIHDLSVKDPYFILPILMGVSMLVQQKLSPPPPDPAQAKMMMLLPVVFTVFFATFPAGLVLYWLTNNCVSVLQQWYVMKTHKTKKTGIKKKK